MSAPDSGQLPSALPAEIEAAIDELYDVGYATRPTKDRARAELTAKIAKYGNTNWLVGYDYRKNEESQEGLVDE